MSFITTLAEKTVQSLTGKKLYKLHIIDETEVAAYESQGYVIRRLDPSITGMWAFGDNAQANSWVRSLEENHVDYLEIAAHSLFRQGWRAEGLRED